MRSSWKVALAGALTVAAMAVSASTAAAWTATGAFAFTAVPGNNLVTTVAGNTLNCTTNNITANLVNVAGPPTRPSTNGGSVTAATFTPPLCTTSISVNCEVTVVAKDLAEWDVRGYAATAGSPGGQPWLAQVTAVFQATYASKAGVVCPVAGLDVWIRGTLNGGVITNNNTGCAAGQNRSRITFTNAGQLSVERTNNAALFGALGTLNGAVQTGCLVNNPRPDNP